MNEEEKKEFKRIKKQSQEVWLDDDDIKFLVNSIEKLQKENELAKKQVEYDKTHICTPQIIKLNYIPVQKVKDKIEEYKNMLKTCNKAKDIDRIKAINERISELQELLEGRK